MKDSYKKILKKNKKYAEKYYLKSLKKTEQQKFLESHLKNDGVYDFSKCYKIADLACGAGTLSYHLNKLFVNSEFSLLDYSEDAIDLAREVNKNKNFQFSVGDIKKLPFEGNSFDIIFIWQTLFMFDINDLSEIYDEVFRVLKPGGKLYVMSLFNFEHDLDIWSRFHDHTLTYEDGQENISYNTCSLKTMNKILNKKVESYKIHKFILDVDLPKTNHRGIATYTKKVICENGYVERIQISGGMIMSWGLLDVKK